MLIIPAIDILDGKVVRLSKGKFDNVTTYGQSPFDQVENYLEHGFKWIHMVDLSGSKEGKFTALKIIEEIKNRFDVKIEFGGGVRSSENVDELIQSGVDLVIVGSLSITKKNELEKSVNKSGADRLIIAIDVIDHSIQIKGWTEDSKVNVFEHIEYCKGLGIKKFLCTDIETDGMLTGPNMKLYSEINSKYPSIDLIASGGVSKIEDVAELNKMKIYGVVIGKAIYEEKINLKELAQIGK